MKRMITIIIAINIIALIFLSIKGNEVQTITTEIDISAPPEKVWKIITDIDQWHEWSPIINKSSGTSSVGAKLDITMMGKEPGSNGPTYKPTITHLEENKNFTWSAHMMAGFIFTNGKILELEATTNGTKLTHSETFKGLLAPVFCGQMEKSVPAMLDKMNKALKELAEK